MGKDGGSGEPYLVEGRCQELRSEGRVPVRFLTIFGGIARHMGGNSTIFFSKLLDWP